MRSDHVTGISTQGSEASEKKQHWSLFLWEQLLEPQKTHTCDSFFLSCY